MSKKSNITTDEPRGYWIATDFHAHGGGYDYEYYDDMTYAEAVDAWEDSMRAYVHDVCLGSCRMSAPVWHDAGDAEPEDLSWDDARWIEIDVEPVAPPCKGEHEHEHEHDWCHVGWHREPHDVYEWCRRDTSQVCRHCGTYLCTGTEPKSGREDEREGVMWYEDANDQSLAWVEAQRVAAAEWQCEYAYPQGDAIGFILVDKEEGETLAACIYADGERVVIGVWDLDYTTADEIHWPNADDVDWHALDGAPRGELHDWPDADEEDEDEDEDDDADEAAE